MFQFGFGLFKTGSVNISKDLETKGISSVVLDINS